MCPLPEANLRYAAVDGYVSYELYHTIKRLERSLQCQQPYCPGCLAKERSTMKRKEVDDDDGSNDDGSGWEGGRKQAAGRRGDDIRKMGDGFLAGTSSTTAGSSTVLELTGRTTLARRTLTRRTVHARAME